VSATQLAVVVFGAFVFLALGSFTCVIIDRLPVHSEEPNQYGEHWDTRAWSEVLGGHSRCSDCGEPVRPWQNIPVVSWLVLRGRCRSCGARIAGYHPLVEAASPLLFLAFVWAFGLDDWRLLPALWLIPLGLAIGVIDLRTLIVPTRIVWPAFAVSVVLCGVVALVEGEPAWLLTGLVGMATLAGPLFLIWFINPKGMGFGDVRLVVLLGWNVGFFAGTRPVAGLVLSLLCLTLAALVGLVIGIAALGARGRKAQVPFGPALILAAWFCVAMAPEILDPFGVYVLS
jgi:leader peptidase (prepilin peptidase)/N-methyltransferase